MANLEDMLQRAYVAQGINKEQQESVGRYLELLAHKDQATYEHSIRVGILSSNIGEYLHLDSKALFYAGLLHDIGKSTISDETLHKTEKYDEQDYEEMRKHSEYAYQMLKGIYNFTADIVVRVHYYQQHGYPDKLPDSHPSFSAATKSTIDFYAMLVALADYYDAASTRVNEINGEIRLQSKSEVKKLLFNNHPHFKKLIDELYRNTIFEDEPVAITPVQQVLTNTANNAPKYRTSREIRRDVQLALALEPVSEKPGCTTRSKDCSRHLKLEYFIAGAVNIGDAFEDMAQRVIESKVQPLIYDLAKQAQLDCKRNREGGRINHGMIEMLTPIIAAQLTYDINYQLTVEEVLNKTHEILKNTTKSDVQHLVALKQIAYDLCAYNDRQISDHNAKNVEEFYEAELASSTRPVSILHNTEFLSGFPTVKRIYDLLNLEPERDLSRRMRDAYLSIKATYHNKLIEGGLTADCCGVALYLLFSHHKTDIIVR